jgi:hypothetical protein
VTSVKVTASSAGARGQVLGDQRLKNSRLSTSRTPADAEIDDSVFGRARRTARATQRLSRSRSSVNLFRFVRMLDLAMSTEAGRVSALCLVAPDPRQEEVRAQLNRPKFARVGPT